MFVTTLKAGRWLRRHIRRWLLDHLRSRPVWVDARPSAPVTVESSTGGTAPDRKPTVLTAPTLAEISIAIVLKSPTGFRRGRLHRHTCFRTHHADGIAELIRSQGSNVQVFVTPELLQQPFLLHTTLARLQGRDTHPDLLDATLWK